MGDDRWNRHTEPVSPAAIVVGRESAFDPGRERYQVGEELGRGGMGRVVAARDTTLDRDVAIKQALDDASLERFEREVRITARLEHPAIVPVHDVGRDQQGRPYYIMRRIAGEPLGQRIARASSVRDRIALVPNVLAAVDAAAFAHAQRIVHLDIKPANILIGAYGETLLIDWGLARLVEDDSPSRGGTPGYMPPEEVRTDRRADVYALGATLHCVLAGERDATLPADVPRELVTIVAKATAEDPAARYADAGALAADLRAFLAGQLVASHAYSPGERLRRWVRRHRIAVVTAAAAAIALIVGGAVAITNVIRERDAAAAARAIAADRAEVMLLERASTLASRDPTRAAALLAELDPASRYLLRARDIAAVAAANGIAHGKHTHRGEVRALALAGKQLVTGGADGTLQLHDLESGTSRILATGAPVTMAAWTGGAITYATTVGIERVQLATGTHTIVVPGVSWFWVTRDKLRYVRERMLLEHDGTEAVIARDVEEAIGAGDVALVRGGGKLRLVDRNGERVLATGDASALAISDDGVLAGAQVAGDLVEWDIATGTERGRWPQLATYALVYAGQQLHHRPRGRAGSLDRLLRGGAVETLRGTSSLMLYGTTAVGTVVIGEGGMLAVLEDQRTHRFTLDTLPIRAIAAQRSSTIFAVGMADGSFRWWDARTLIPVAVPLPPGAVVCAFDATHVYALVGTDAFAIARGDGVARAIGSGMYRDCRSAPGGVLGVRMPDVPGAAPMDLLDAQGGITPLPGQAVVDGVRLVYTPDGTALFEQVASGTRTPRATAPATLTFLAARDGWIAAALDDKRVLRVDPRGHVDVVAVDAPVDAVALTARGSVWVAGGDALRLITGTQVAKIATTTSAIVELAAVGDDAAAVMLRDGSIWHATASGLVLRVDAAAMPRATSLGGVRMAAAVVSGHTLGVHYLDTGERSVRALPDLAWRVHVSRDDRAVLAMSTNPPVVALIYEDPVPADPAALPGWLARATNAVIAHDRDALTWR